jgi:hypothetical protein
VSDKRPRRAPALFDGAAFADDAARAGGSGGDVARSARSVYGAEGVPIAELRACQREGSDGTQLANCVKVYLPPPVGRFGMVFRIEKREGRTLLVYAAFGIRHHPAESNAETVYEIAHRRLHSS